MFAAAGGSMGPVQPIRTAIEHEMPRFEVAGSVAPRVKLG